MDTFEKRSHYFRELSLCLQRNGFTTQNNLEQMLSVEWEERPLCRITEAASVLYQQEDIKNSSTIKLFEHFCNFFRYFHEAIRCIEWVVVPQIDNSHIDLRFGCWLTSDRNEGGGERHRGMTSGQHDPKQPHKNTKAPGRHEATRTHEMTYSFMYCLISHL